MPDDIYQVANSFSQPIQGGWTPGFQERAARAKAYDKAAMAIYDAVTPGETATGAVAAHPLGDKDAFRALSREDRINTVKGYVEAEALKSAFARERQQQDSAKADMLYKAAMADRWKAEDAARTREVQTADAFRNNYIAAADAAKTSGMVADAFSATAPLMPGGAAVGEAYRQQFGQPPDVTDLALRAGYSPLVASQMVENFGRAAQYGRERQAPATSVQEIYPGVSLWTHGGQAGTAVRPDLRFNPAAKPTVTVKRNIDGAEVTQGMDAEEFANYQAQNPSKAAIKQRGDVAEWQAELEQHTAAMKAGDYRYGVLNNSSREARIVQLRRKLAEAGVGTGKPAAAPYPDGTRLQGKDGKFYVVKNGQPVPE